MLEQPPQIGIDLRPDSFNITVGDSVELTTYQLFPGFTGEYARRPEELTVRQPVARATLGLLVADAPGSTWVVARDGAFVDSALVRVLPRHGTFRMTLVYADDVPARWREALEAGARRWEQVIDGELPGVTLATTGGDCPTPPGEPASPPLSGPENGVRIYVGQSGHYPPGTYVEITGGPCLQRPLPTPTTILGLVSINRNKNVDGIPSDRLRYLAVHELGHALGLVALVQGKQPHWYDVNTGLYFGAMALEGCRRFNDHHCLALRFDQGAHWQTHNMGDVMGGAGLGDLRRIELATVGALMDLGYPARWSGAGPY